MYAACLFRTNKLSIYLSIYLSTRYHGTPLKCMQPEATAVHSTIHLLSCVITAEKAGRPQKSNQPNWHRQD
uniref:Uncharacterized protein n=1 Tax=Anguilla anguilla TaxID=7936 RepID=A0A0E9TPD8_ANGAN